MRYLSIGPPAACRPVLFLLTALILMSVPAAAAEVGLFLELRIPAGGSDITALAFGPGGTLAFGDDEGRVYLVDIDGAGAGSASAGDAFFEGPGRDITAISFSPDGRYLAVSPDRKGVWLLALPGEGGGPARETTLFDGSGDHIDVLAFSPDGRHLAGGGKGKRVTVWEVPSGSVRAEADGHDGDILALAFDGEGRTLLSAAKDGRMIIFDGSSFAPLRKYELEASTVPGSGVDVTAARFSSDRLVLAVATDEHKMAKGGSRMIFEYHIAFFDVSKGVHLKTLEAENGRMERLALYPGNCFVAFDNSTKQSGSVALRDIESGSLAVSYPTATPCSLIEFSPDGRHLAGAAGSGGGDEVVLWSVDYEMPASGCFSGRVRLASSPDPVMEGEGPWIAAVLPFAGIGSDADLGRTAAHFLESALSGKKGLKLIERARVDDIIGELELQKSGMVDESTAVEMGRLLGAGLIITGNIDRAGSDLVISSRIIDVGTGEILGTRQVHCGQCGADDIFDAVDILSGVLFAE